MPKRLFVWLFAAFASVAVAGTVSAQQRITDGSIRYVTGSSQPRLEISLGTNPAILEPAPSPLDFEAQMANQQRLMAFANWDDPNVTITIPLIDYGGGASFTDAYIAKGRGVSFDAGYFIATNKIQHAGSVIIVKFTPDVIEGSYSAQLFSADKPKEPKSEGSVSGWFRISLPGLHDPRRDNEVSDGEKVRLNAAAMWDTLRGTGMALDDADMFSGGGGAGGGGGAASVAVPVCDCRCEAVLSLPEDHECVRPGAECTEQRRVCAVPAPMVGDLDAIIDLMLGPDAPPEARAAVLPSLQDLTPEELAQMLQFYRQAAGQQP